MGQAGAPQPTADGPIPSSIWTESARRRWREVLEVAADQHGMVALAQLEACGLPSSSVRSRVQGGWLTRVHAGVYAVGCPQPGRWSQMMAAALACGPAAVVSHRSAVELFGLCRADRGPIDVTAPCRRGRAPHGVRAHRDGTLTELDTASERGIPCTSLARTLLDFAAVAPGRELRSAIGEAEVGRILDYGEVRDLLRRSRGRRGVARLRLAMDEIRPETRRTRSELEREFLRLCERAKLPMPEVNVPLRVGGHTQRPDFLWREGCLIVEADGRAFHDTASAFQLDRRREQRFQLAGWRVSRCTWEQVFDEPGALAAIIRGLLLEGS